jgi:opacity protein-like surface antigen
MSTKTTVIVAALAVLAVGVANAGDHDMKGWYIGVGAGSAAIELKADESLSSSVDETTTAVRLFGGYRPMKYFQFELGVGDLGEINAQLQSSGDAYDAALSGIDLNVFGMLPLANEMVDLYIKVGIAETEIRETVIDDAGVDPPRQNEWTSVDYLVGAGVQINFLKDRNLGLRLDYSVHDTKTRVESWDTVALSVLYRF